MHCPKCTADKFNKYESMEGIEVDFCSACRGIWFDKGELSLFVDSREDLPLKNSSAKLGSETKFNCPKCVESLLIEMPYLAGDDLMIDYCRSCLGIWLDEREVIKVRELAKKTSTLGKLTRIINQLRNDGCIILESKQVKK